MENNKFLNSLNEVKDEYLIEALPMKYKQNRVLIGWKRIVASVIIVVLCCVTVTYAAYNAIMSRTEVNQKLLPDIDEMRCIDEADFLWVDDVPTLTSYDKLVKLINVDLLDSGLSEESQYMNVTVKSDKENYAMIQVDNFILGDTKNFVLVEGTDHYNCDPGEEYASTITLEIDMILSRDQLETGFDMEYLGDYEYIDSYISELGAKINLLQETTKEITPELTTNKIAEFVFDGIKYKVSGRVSIDKMLWIVNSME